MNKLIKSALLSAFFICLFTMSYSQVPYLDSVNVQVGNKMEINMKIFSYDGLHENISQDLKSLRTILLDKKDLPSQGAYTIYYVPDVRLTIKKGEAGERIIWDKGGMTRYTFDNRLSMLSGKYQLQVQFNDPAEIISDDLQKNLVEVIDSTCSIRGRITTTYHYAYQDGRLVRFPQLDKSTGQKDVLSLNGGIGFNLVKGHPVIDLSAQLGFIFSKGGIWKNQYYVSYNQLFFFEDLVYAQMNGFLNVGYKRNLSNTIGKPDWLGVECGYLLSRHGDLFPENTMKIAFNYEIAKSVSLAPQLYISGNFKELFPAIRIGFGF